MIRQAVVVLAFVGSVAMLSAQKSQTTFDAASIKRSAANGSSRVVPGVFLPDGRWSAQSATLSMLLRSAYTVPADRIVGTPSWAHSERFDIATTAAPNTSAEQLRAMAQQLLADRFGLRAHWEQRTTDVIALVRVDPSGPLGPGLRPSGAACQRSDPATGAPVSPPRDSPCAETIRRLDGGAMQFRLRDRSLLTDLLIISGARSEIGGTIVDRTGLEGNFDIDIEFVYRSQPDPGSLGLGVPLAVAMADQLGLRFDQRRELVPVLVIDSVDRPTPD
jgi:uncharacterized protein (TIGR03435 family)